MVSHVALKRITVQELHLDCLPVTTRKAFLTIIKLPFLKNSSWYLAGGTALTLQVGHRQSVDLDFFTSKGRFQITSLERTLFNTGRWTTTFRQEGTLYGTFCKAKMSYIAYPFFQPTQRLYCENAQIIVPADIAVMKIIAISQRGRKRDFIDLYWYCQNYHESLIDIIKRTIRQYPGQQHNINHFLKSLVYFVDAESDPMPRLFFQTTWLVVKRFFKTEIPKVGQQLLT